MDHIPRSESLQVPAKTHISRGGSAQMTPEQSQGYVVRKNNFKSETWLICFSKYSVANRISPELLVLTFNRAIPPQALLDQALCSGDRSPWCHSLRLMKSIVLVFR